MRDSSLSEAPQQPTSLRRGLKPIAVFGTMFFLPQASHWTTWTVCLVVIWSSTGLNIWGAEVVGRFSVVLTVVVMIPIVAMVILGWSEISLSTLTPFLPEGEASDALRYALIFGIWSFSGYSGLAYAGEEIVDTEYSYPKVLAIFVPFGVMVLVIPLLVGLAADPNWSQWGPAQFTQVGFVLGGAWLAGAISTAAQISLLALFIGELFILSRLPYALVRDGLLLVAIAPVLISIFLIFTIEYEKLFLGLGCMAAGPLLYFSVQWWNDRSGAAGA